MKHRLAALLVAGTLALSACSAPAPEAAPAPAPASTSAPASATPTPTPAPDPAPLAFKLSDAEEVANHRFMGYVGAVKTPENESGDEMALYKGAIDDGESLSVIVDVDPARDPESYPLTSLCDGLHMFNAIVTEADGVGFTYAELVNESGEILTSCVDRTDMPIDLSVLYGEQ